MTNTPNTIQKAVAHGNYVRGSASKVRRVLDQIRGKSYRDALIMLEFMPYRSTEPITKVLRSAVANAEHNLGMDPSTLIINTAAANNGPVTPWGKPALGLKTRKKNKPSNKLVLRKRRRVSKRSRGGRDS